MTNKKVCVYAIAKNEMKFIDLWLENMSEADYIVVLDTGSTDGTYEFLQKDPRVTRVEQKIFNPWRFDDARNESMNLIPDDAEIYVCTDPDERFVPGWCKTLKEGWVDDATRATYTYAWNHNEMGEPCNVFKYDKIHTKGYKWIFPVHEVLWPIDDDWSKEKRLDYGEKIYLHHWQDLSVNRKDYMELLKLSVQENPDNPHVRHLYAREFILRQQNDIAYHTFFEVLNLPRLYNEPQFGFVLLDTLLMVASLAQQRGYLEQAIYWCNQFLAHDDTYREPYLLAAEIYNDKGQFQAAKSILDIMYKKCYQHYTWVEKEANWISTDKLVLARTLYGLGDFMGSLENTNFVLSHSPNNLQALKLKVLCLEQLQNQK